jgi:signal peptidase II
MVYVLTIIFWVTIDQLSKLYILSHFSLHQSRVIVPKFLSLTYSHNPGGAFGILALYPGFFLILSSVLTILGIILIWNIAKMSKGYQFALGSIIGGAAGNLIDRIRIGKVVDFIDFKFWYTFNVADIAICVGVGILMILLFREKSIIPDETVPAPPDIQNDIRQMDAAGPEFIAKKQEDNLLQDENIKINN